MKNKDFLPGLIFFSFAQIMVALNIVVSKFLISSIPLLVLLEIRFLFACIVLLPMHYITRDRNQTLRTYFSKLNSRDWFYIFAQGLCGGVFFNCLMLSGLTYTDANVAGIVASVLPFIVALMSWLILREKMSVYKVICVFFAAMGMMVIAFDKLQIIGDTHSFFGDFIIFLALLPDASYYVISKLYTHRLPVFLASFVLNGINAALLLPMLLLVHWDPSVITPSLGLLVILTGITSGLFYVFWFKGAMRLDGIMASISTAIMPVATILLSWAILGEKLTGIEFSGMLLVLFSIILYARR